VTPERYQRLTDLFEAACDLPQAERPAFLERVSQGDEELRSHLERLLAAELRSDFLAIPEISREAGGLIPEHASNAPLPVRFGRYRVLKLLGEGGMGSAYEAEQESPRRRVAIKTIRAGLRTPQLLRRFEHEANILGRLRHPGIAQVYEAGVEQTPAGPAPFFAMELVHGPPLHDFLAKSKPDRRRKLALFASICDGVQHAHQHGVIHRDLKPANILVDTSAAGVVGASGAPGGADASALMPKILDFGVARLTDPDEQLNTMRTEAGTIVGTLAYMSPEQVAGDAARVDARADVYALGVILFEMLTGRLPHDLTAQTIAQAARTISEREAPRMSTIDRSLRGDLETICGKAMEKERDRRYQSASEFAADVRRFLCDEPIAARPATVTYQFRKFVQRNRGLVFGAAMALLALVGGLVASTALYLRAERNRAIAEASQVRADHEAKLSRGVRDYLITGLLKAADPLRMGYDVKMMDALSHASDGLQERFADDPETEAAIRYDLADVLASLSRFKQSEAEYRRCIEILEKTAGRDAPITIRALNGLLTAVTQQQPGAALPIAQDALDRAERSLDENDPLRLTMMIRLGNALQGEGRDAQAMPLLRKALAILDRPDFVEEADTVETGLTALAYCEQRAGRAEEALALLRRCMERARSTRGENNPTTILTTSNLIAALNRRERFEEAVALASGLPEAAERVYPPGHLDRAFPYLSSANALRGVGRFQEAARLALKARETFEGIYDDLSAPVHESVSVLRQIYSAWPGHAQELRTWCLAAMRSELMVADATWLPRLRESLAECASQCRQGQAGLDEAALLEILWNQRDQFAPAGHRRRAAYMANLARLMETPIQSDRRAEALTLASEALEAAEPRETAQSLIQAARDEALAPKK